MSPHDEHVYKDVLFFPQGVGTNDEVLIEILASRTSDQIKEITKVYKKGEEEADNGG